MIYIKIYIKKKLPVFSLFTYDNFGYVAWEITIWKSSVCEKVFPRDARNAYYTHVRFPNRFPLSRTRPSARDSGHDRRWIEQWILQKLRANRPCGRARGPARQTWFVRWGGGRGSNCSRDEKTEHNARTRRTKRRTMIFRYIRTDVHKSRRYDIGQSSPMRPRQRP